ncbi:2-hydroxymuconic semialdehyde dehydrogenase [Limnochorda pilosa]|uniref:2-hydroxymuconic semialdehyde dehydrogenase n=2 Tax=Limnochorda pilosa TaxID=1555112 RepID=A0A0K2SLK9_LIMPI|nr:2-hydroxymuconic semialdehyde dehydrogenase [Limnochorda pilosa]
MEHVVPNYVAGEFVETGSRFPLHYPATGEQIGTACEAGPEEIDRAVRAARAAFQEWSRTRPSERRAVLNRFADAILKRGEEFGRLETFDVGRPIRDNGRPYIERAAANIRFFADFAAMLGSECYPMENGYLNYVLRHPVGVAALITPWNVPLLLETWKLGPALAFGNTAVLKPAEWTPLGAWKLAECAREAGLPEGVFNVVNGFGTGSAGELLVRHPGVDLISFTGETTTGQTIMAAAAPTLKRLSFELGGKGANIVFADADLDRAVEVSIRAGFFNQGEFCLSGPRLFVEEPIYERFLAAFSEQVGHLRVGDPLDPETRMGPMMAPEHLERVLGFVERARARGARVTGGERLSLPGPLGDGNFISPAIVTGAGTEDEICQQEVFGPVVTVAPFRTEEEVIAWANGTRYGLSAVVQTGDVGRAHRVAAALQAGTVWVNDFFVRDLRVPFGGMKQSGIGREGGHYSLEFYTEAQTICVAVQGPSRKG